MHLVKLIAGLSVLFSGAVYAEQLAVSPIVAAVRETEAAPSKGDAADDPAIWIHPVDRAQSLVIGTNKGGGLMVFDLAGKQLQYFDGIEPNNVDVRDGFQRNGKPVSLALASDRAKNTILAWSIDPSTRALTPLPVEGVTPSTEVYGFCLYKAPDGALHGIVTTKTGVMEQWLLSPVDNGNKLVAKLVRTHKFEGQCEGCVADDALGALFVGEEGGGVWKLSTQGAEAEKAVKIADVQPAGRLVPDVEGLALLKLGGDGGYLIVSSQGSIEFCVFERAGAHALLGCFQLNAEGGKDAVTETDGIEVVAGNLGEDCPGGLFVAQDDENPGGNQNFKFAAWEAIAGALNLTSPH